MEFQIIGLQKQVKRLQIWTGLLAVAILVLVASAFNATEDHNQVLRVRGLIIEDDQGRERILMVH